MNFTGQAARLPGDTRGPVRLDWRAAYAAEIRQIRAELLAERAAGHDRWTAARRDGLYAPAPTTGLRRWSDDRITRYAEREAERRVNKAIHVHNEQAARAAMN